MKNQIKEGVWQPSLFLFRLQRQGFQKKYLPAGEEHELSARMEDCRPAARQEPLEAGLHLKSCQDLT